LAEPHHVVVDGSNLATEGRTLPSLKQLDEAVRAYAEEDPEGRITVVVDASFEHRIDESEREQVREAMLNGEIVSPPAGAIGRGDAFVLRIAERTGAIVLSNDSFQEFHGEHPWLFDEGRLIGGKPVPGVGWIFTHRLPVRGVKSRAATAETRSKRDPESAPAKAAELAKAAKKAARRSSKKSEPVLDSSWPITPTSPPPAGPPRKAAALVDPTLSTAIDEAVAEALDPPEAKKAAKAATKKKGAAKKVSGPKKAAATKKAPATKKARAAKKAPADKTPVAKKAAAEARAASPQRTRAHLAAASPVAKKAPSSPPPAVNEPLAFINFVATYPVGSTLEGEVVSFTSHGAMVDVALPDGGRLHCYIPLSAMGTPPPTKARELLNKGEVRTFVLAGLDPPRRVAELSLPLPPAKKRRSPAKKAATKPAKKAAKKSP
jgi:Zc3h12a-like Ribonuclease NYN domain